jgi:2-polyprenyl-6-methoxyphenol hydroxylase-like FAD-dependent oxidoreductase
MSEKTVLISGAGIAGATLAYWLARAGFVPTVVERAGRQLSSGSPVDVRGEAVLVAERMSVLPRLQDAATSVRTLSFLNAKGRRTGRINLRALRRSTASREVELPRGDLAAALLDASRNDAGFMFGDSIVSLNQDPSGVDVTFEHAAARRFDLVIGADGLHSAVRRLAFGPEAEFVRHMGLYVATMPLHDFEVDARDVLMYNTPGRAVSIHPAAGHALAAFIFRSPAAAGFDYRDTGQHKRLLADAYAGGGWRVPELLARVRVTDDLYFDSVSQVVLGQWSRGRTALLGDAASCVSLFGEGSSLAIAGAATLASALSAGPDYGAAFAGYEARHRVLVEPKQLGVSQAATLLVPATSTGIVVRNLATRLWPAVAAGQWVRRAVTGSLWRCRRLCSRRGPDTVGDCHAAVQRHRGLDPFVGDRAGCDGHRAAQA